MEMQKLVDLKALVISESQENANIFSERAVVDAKRHLDIQDGYKAMLVSDHGLTPLAPAPLVEEAEITQPDPYRSMTIDIDVSEWPVIKEIGEGQRTFLNSLKVTNTYFLKQKMPEITYGDYFGGDLPEIIVEMIASLKKLLGQTVWQRFYGDYEVTPTDAFPDWLVYEGIPSCLSQLATVLNASQKGKEEVTKKNGAATWAKLTEATKKKKVNGGVRKNTKA